jgi:hypothetical protein
LDIGLQDKRRRSSFQEPEKYPGSLD